MKLVKLGLAISLIVGTAFANASDIEFGIQAGYGVGGDALATSSGGDLNAGDGLLFGIYGLVPVSDDGTLLMKFSANMLYGSKVYSNLDAEISRFYIDALVVKRFNKFQLGAGIVYHISPTLEYNYTSGTNETYDADNVFGLALETTYNFTESFNLGLRYTNIEYDFDNVSKDYDASNIAITAGYTF